MRGSTKLLAGMGLAVVVSVPLALAVAGTTPNSTGATVQPPTASPALSATYNPAQSFAPLIKAVEPAVVAIEVQGTVSQVAFDIPPEFRDLFGVPLPPMGGEHLVQGEGSGFVISAEGLLVTNHHVVESARKIHARFSDGTVVEATLIGSDPSNDVALLRLPKGREWPHVELGTSRQLQVGDWVLAMGNPLHLGITATAGIVSGKGRTIGNTAFDDFLQTDAAINQGNSGGPLFDLNGKVVGVNTAIIQGANTIGFAIPIDTVKRVVEDLEDDGRVSRGYIGVRPEQVDAALASALGIEPARGALIRQVFKDTPAEAAGLRAGDVVLAIDGEPIADERGLVRAVAAHHPGDKVQVLVVRDGKEKTFAVVLMERPADEEAVLRSIPDVAPEEAPPAEEDEERGRADIGLVYNVQEDSEALVVRTVAADSPLRGLVQPGDVLVSVNDNEVHSRADVDKLLAVSGRLARFHVKRDEADLFVTVPIR